MSSKNACGVLVFMALIISGVAQAETIEFCGGLYRYIDIEFMRPRASEGCLGTRWPRAGEPLGWTWSTTPPDADVEWIDEVATVCYGLGPVKEVVLSKGRKIPRYRVSGKSYEWGNYVTDRSSGRTEYCRSVEFTAPPTARRPSAEVIERSAPIVFGPVLEGAITHVAGSAIIKVGRRSIRLYGVASIPGQQAAVYRLLGNRQASCREVDLGGFQCLVDGEDLSVRLASEGLVKPYSGASMKIRAAAAAAPSLPAPTAGSASSKGTRRNCVALESSIMRNRHLAQNDSRYVRRLEQMEQAYRKNCLD